MSYGASPCSAWVIEATHENIVKLNAIPVEQEDLDVSLFLVDRNYCEEWLTENWWENHSDIEVKTSFGVKGWIFKKDDDGDIYDDIDNETFYISFPFRELFEPTDAMKKLASAGLEPENKSWVQFG